MKPPRLSALGAVLAMIGLFVAAPCRAADLTVAGTQFVGLLAKADFAGAVAHFDATMKTALPEPKLRETWQALQKQVGPFKRQLRARVERQGGYEVVLVTCQFEQAVLDAKVVFNPQRRIAGLFFVPTQPAADASAPPPYAKTNAFRERDFTVSPGKWALPGTLTVPADGARPHPAVVLVHGSGPNDRDETVGANRPFRDLAWGLATKGIAVLRYDKRTLVHAARFMGPGLTGLTVKEETIDDALNAARQLRATPGIDPRRVFILGHSLGGTLAPRIGQGDPAITGLILLAGSCRPLEDLMVEQTRYLLTLNGDISDVGRAKLGKLQAEVVKVKKLTAADAAAPGLLLGAPATYWLDLRQHDPLALAQHLNQPMFLLQGQRDYQVPQAELDLWKGALGSHPNVTFKLYPKLNHLFIPGEGKSTPAEYETAGHVDEAVINDIAAWIQAH